MLLVGFCFFKLLANLSHGGLSILDGLGKNREEGSGALGCVVWRSLRNLPQIARKLLEVLKEILFITSMKAKFR